MKLIDCSKDVEKEFMIPMTVMPRQGFEQQTGPGIRYVVWTNVRHRLFWIAEIRNQTQDQLRET